MAEIAGMRLVSKKDQEKVIRDAKDEGFGEGKDYERLSVGRGRMAALLDSENKIVQMWLAVKDDPESGLESGELAAIAAAADNALYLLEVIEYQYNVVVGGGGVDSGGRMLGSRLNEVVSYDPVVHRGPDGVMEGEEVVVINAGIYDVKTGKPVSFPIVNRPNESGSYFDFVSMAKSYVEGYMETPIRLGRDGKKLTRSGLVDRVGVS